MLAPHGHKRLTIPYIPESVGLYLTEIYNSIQIAAAAQDLTIPPHRKTLPENRTGKISLPGGTHEFLSILSRPGKGVKHQEILGTKGDPERYGLIT